MGTGYKGGVTHYRSIGENLSSTRSLFLYNEGTGYFGTRGRSNDTHVRHISSSDPVITARKFYDTLTAGGIERILKNEKGVFTQMRDESYVTFRQISSSDGSPVVQITISVGSKDFGGIKTQKIHFVKEADE